MNCRRPVTNREALQESESKEMLQQVAKFLSSHERSHLSSTLQTATCTEHLQIQALLPGHLDPFWLLALITVPLVLLSRKIKLLAHSAAHI